MYSQFNRESRIELAGFRRTGDSITECSRKLGMSYSSVWRELERNTSNDGIYRGAKAHKKFLERRKDSRVETRVIENNRVLKRHIVYRLSVSRWSPEQIAGRIRLEKKYPYISAQSIYLWIYRERPEYKKYLKVIGTKGKYRRRKGTNKRAEDRKTKQIRRIDQRPDCIDQKERIGDFEGDTVIGRNKKTRVLTHTERVSGYGLLTSLSVVSAQIVQDEIISTFQTIPKRKRYSCTKLQQAFS